MPLPLEFWFEFASTYSYIAAMRIEDEAARAGAHVQWKPFLLGPIFEAQQGIKGSPFNEHPQRGAYMWRDMERLCEKFGLPWRKPSVFPRNPLLAARVALSAVGEPWFPRFMREVYRANFALDLDIASREVIAGILHDLRLHPDEVFAKAESPENKAALRAQTERAAQLGIFGAPNLIVGSELFFGQDRIADALAYWRSTG